LKGAGKGEAGGRECTRSQNLNLMATDPDIDLFESGFQDFFILTEELVRRPRSLDINDETKEPILIKCTLVFPGAHCRDHIRCGGGEPLKKFQIGLVEFCCFDSPAVVISQW